jgi:hypothetical protein
MHYDRWEIFMPCFTKPSLRDNLQQSVVSDDMKQLSGCMVEVSIRVEYNYYINLKLMLHYRHDSKK